MKKGLTFDAESHKYTLNGKVLPSVTQIIKDVTKGEQEWDGNCSARDFGTAVHKTLEYYDKGILGEYDPRMEPYIKVWDNFKFEKKVTIIENELIGYSDFGFAGTIDRIVDIDGYTYILDIKTGKQYKDHPLQLAAYNMLYREHQSNKNNSYLRACVYLSEDGYKFVEYKDKNDEEVFCSMFLVWQWKKGKI